MLALKDATQDEADYAEAEAALRALSEQYPAYAEADVAEMKSYLAALEAAPGDVEATAAALFGVAHNVKGQGACFGYELMTDLGEDLCDLLRDRRTLEAAEIRTARALIEACETVLAERLIGDGGARGAALRAAAGHAS